MLLGVAAIASGILLLWLARDLTFFQDDWNLLLHRRGFSGDAFFEPNAEHIIVAPAAIFKALLAVFGMDSDRPFRIVLTSLLILTAVLLYAFVRRRVGEWLALLAAAVILFLGPAWNVLLWSIEIALAGSMAAGIGSLLALERNDRRGDILACLLILASISFGSLGLSFVAAAAVDVWLRRSERGLSRAFVPVIPLVAYALWYLTYGHEAVSRLTAENVLTSPLFLVEGVAASLSALLGVTAAFNESIFMKQLHWEQWTLFALALALALAVLAVRRRAVGISNRIWVVAALAASFWLLAGFNETPARTPPASRYMYVGAILLVLVLAELFRGYRPSRQALGIAIVAAAFAIGFNLGMLRDGRDWFAGQSEFARVDLGTVEIARDSVNPFFRLTTDVAGVYTLTPVDAGSYLSAVDAYGSPADSPDRIAGAPEPNRSRADLLLARALPITAGPARGSEARIGGPVPAPEGARLRARSSRRGSCVVLPAGAARREAELRLPRGGALVRAGAGGVPSLRLRRFGGQFLLNAGEVRGGSTTLLDIPADRASRPWHLAIHAAQQMTVCGRPPTP